MKKLALTVFPAMIASVCLLSACNNKSADPPIDLIKTQREDMQKAKGVEQTIMKQDDDARKQVDDASK